MWADDQSAGASEGIGAQCGSGRERAAEVTSVRKGLISANWRKCSLFLGNFFLRSGCG